MPIHHEPDYAFVLIIVSAVGEFTVAICLFIGRFIERDFGSQMYWKNTSFWNTWRKKYNKKTVLTVNYEDMEGDFHNWEVFVASLERAKKHAAATAVAQHPQQHQHLHPQQQPPQIKVSRQLSNDVIATKGSTEGLNVMTSPSSSTSSLYSSRDDDGIVGGGDDGSGFHDNGRLFSRAGDEEVPLLQPNGH